MICDATTARSLYFAPVLFFVCGHVVQSVQKVLAALFSRTSLIALSLEAIIWPTEILLGLTALVKLASMGYAWLDATTFAAQP